METFVNGARLLGADDFAQSRAASIFPQFPFDLVEVCDLAQDPADGDGIEFTSLKELTSCMCLMWSST